MRKICPFSIGQHTYYGVIDTGADISLISKSFVNKIPSKYITCRNSTRTGLIGVTGAEMSTLGTVTIKFRIGQQNLSFTFGVVKQLSKHLIFGLNFLEQTKARIDCGTKTIAIGKSVVLLKDKSIMSDMSTLSCDLVVVRKATKLPAGSLTYVDVNMPKSCHKNLRIVTPLDTCDPFHDQADITMPDAITQDRVNQVMILNKSLNNIYLKKRQVIGIVEEISDVEILPIDREECDTLFSSPGLENLEPSQQAKAKLLLEDFKSLFVKSDLELGRTDLVSMKVETGDNVPIKQRPYRTPWSQRSLVEEHIDSMLKANVIQESASPWASPIVLVNKKDGSKRFCIDYRKLNRVIKQNSYPLPNIDDILTSMHHSTVFSCLDLKSGYWQIPLDPESKEKTAFICHAGLYHFNVVPFGLSIAPPVFQELMDKVLIGIKGKYTTAYLDDIVIYSRNVEEHICHLREVFKRLSDAGLKLKLSKCDLFKNKIKYLGHEVSEKGIKPDVGKVKVISELKAPTNIREVRRIIGMAGFYRKFIPNFSEITQPLTALTKKSATFSWDDEKQKAFDTLKEKLTTAPILAYPDPSKPYKLYTDASLHAIGAVLTQVFPEGEKVIEYVSRQLTDGQRKWPTIERECYAIISSIGKLRHYLVGSKFTIYTDHLPLRSLFTADMRNPRIQRWAIILEEYDCDIQYTTGKNNVNADMLSRIRGEPSTIDETFLLDSSVSTGNKRQANIDDDISAEVSKEDDIIHQSEQEVTVTNPSQDTPLEVVEIPDLNNIQNISTAQKTDPKLSVIMARLTEEPLSVPDYHVEDDTLYHVSKPVRFDTTQRLQLVIPDVYVKQLISVSHEEGGHAGLDKTYDRVRTRYFWENMYKDIATYLNKCDICQRRQNKRYRAPMQHMPIPNHPFEVIGIDTVGPLPDTHAGNQYIITIVDHMTSWPELYAVPNKTAETVATLLMEKFIPRHGCPKYILSDNGTEFCNSVIELITKKMKISHLRTSPYHAQTNGRTERFHRYLNDVLAKYIDGDYRNWDTYLSSVEMAYRTSVNETTRHTPFFLVYGRDPILPMDTLLNPKFKYHGEDYVPITLQRLHVAFEAVKKNMSEARERNKHNYDKRAVDRQFEPGDAVYLYDATVKSGSTKKLTSPWRPFYRIIEQTSPVNYRIKSQPTGKTKIVHVNMLKAAHPDETWDIERDVIEPIVTENEETTLRQQPIRAAKLVAGYSVGGRRLVETARGLDQTLKQTDTPTDSDSDSDENIPLSVIRKRLRSTGNSDSDEDKGANTKKQHVTVGPSTSGDPSSVQSSMTKALTTKRARESSPETSSKRIAPEPMIPMEVSENAHTDGQECEAAMEVHFFDCQEETPLSTTLANMVLENKTVVQPIVDNTMGFQDNKNKAIEATATRLSSLTGILQTLAGLTIGQLAGLVHQKILKR